MGDSDGTVILAEFDYPFRPELIGDVRPVVFAFLKLFPVFLRLIPRDQFPKRGDVEYYAVVKVRIKMKFCRAAKFVGEVAQFGDELLLAIHVLFDLLGLTAGTSRRNLPFAQRLQAVFFQADLGLHIVQQRFIEDVLVQAVVVP